jgi:hypothetical protein
MSIQICNFTTPQLYSFATPYRHYFIIKKRTTSQKVTGESTSHRNTTSHLSTEYANCWIYAGDALNAMLLLPPRIHHVTCFHFLHSTYTLSSLQLGSSIHYTSAPLSGTSITIRRPTSYYMPRIPMDTCVWLREHACITGRTLACQRESRPGVMTSACTSVFSFFWELLQPIMGKLCYYYCQLTEKKKEGIGSGRRPAKWATMTSGGSSWLINHTACRHRINRSSRSIHQSTSTFRSVVGRRTSTSTPSSQRWCNCNSAIWLDRPCANVQSSSILVHTADRALLVPDGANGCPAPCPHIVRPRGN